MLDRGGEVMMKIVLIRGLHNLETLVCEHERQRVKQSIRAQLCPCGCGQKSPCPQWKEILERDKKRNFFTF